MENRIQDVQETSGSDSSANSASLKLLLPENPPSSFIGRHSLAAAPLCCWMLDALTSKRVLTVGGVSELLHLVLCQSAEEQSAETVCAHIASDFTRTFLDARVRYGAVRSQLLYADPAAARLGAEGQFDLIILSLAAAPDAALVRSWRNGLGQGGVLVIHLTGTDELEIAPDAMWRVGDEQLALFWEVGALEIVKALGNMEGPTSTQRTLGDVLATFVALLCTQKARQAQESADAKVAALREQHRLDLVMLTRKLAELEELNITQRTELKAAKAALEKMLGLEDTKTDEPDKNRPQE